MMLKWRHMKVSRVRKGIITTAPASESSMATFEFDKPGHRRGVAVGRRVGSIEHCGWGLQPKRFRSAHTKRCRKRAHVPRAAYNADRVDVGELLRLFLDRTGMG